ncbi:MAG: LCP family protein [Acidothermales bacterium]|nr:LCP family protein [Acidothermales bacterium]
MPEYSDDHYRGQDADDGYYSRTYQSSRLHRRGDGGYGGGPRRTRPPGQRRTGRRVLGVLLTLVLVYLLIYVGILATAYGKLDKVDALADYPGRPAATPGQDWLLVGSDSRAGLTKKQQNQMHTGHTGGQRADTMMLLHIPAGGGKATLVSFPRDSYVPIPGHGRNKLNAAYSLGGPKLAVRTIEGVTDIRIDHYMEVGFGGFAGAVDAVGGVNICVKRTLVDKKQHITFKKGCQDMDGRHGLMYVRSRYSDPRGDFGRVERQRQFLGALFHKAASPGILLNPFRAGNVAFSSAEGVTVDKSTGMFDLARLFWTMRKASSGGIKTLTVPDAGTANEPGAGSVVRWDRPKALKLFSELRNDQPVTVHG